MTTKIAIYSQTLSPRIEYVFKLIFKDLLNCEAVCFFDNAVAFQKSDLGIKISYGTFFDAQTIFFAKETELLTERGVSAPIPDIIKTAIYPLAYPSSDKRSILPFDFPAFAFYLLSRYEEYQPFTPDIHGRFPASESLAYRNDFLQLPLVDLWAKELYHRLSLYCSPEKLPSVRNFSFQPSYDIDYAWAYRNKGWMRQMGAIAKDILQFRFSLLGNRLQVLFGRKPDPYYTFDYLDSLHQRYPELTPIYFWLVGDYGKFDKNCPYYNTEFQALVKKIASKYTIGLHPSYVSNRQQHSLAEEKLRLESLFADTTQQIKHSRQHFLKLKFPDTYQRLLHSNIREEYSMGYADAIGFRASIARSYYWYDLSTERETTLRIHPFMFMDVTLKNYLKISPDAVLDYVRPVMEQCKSVGGELVCIWHNNSFSEVEGWEGWRQVYESILAELMA